MKSGLLPLSPMSRFGPIVPVAPASLSVWHAVHPALVKTAFPAAALPWIAVEVAEVVAPPVVVAALVVRALVLETVVVAAPVELVAASADGKWCASPSTSTETSIPATRLAETSAKSGSRLRGKSGQRRGMTSATTRL